jgi:hypothetical protein
MTELNPAPKRKPNIIWLIVLLIVLIILLIVAISGLSRAAFGDDPQPTATEQAALPTSTEISAPTEVPTEAVVNEPTPTEMPPLEGADLTLQILQEEFIPENNPSDLATRLGGKSGIPLTDPDPDAPYSVGAAKRFWVTNVDTNENFEIDTTLQYADDVLYIWVENSVAFNSLDLELLGKEFSEQIYPTNREFFGSEWTPGIDEDPHIYFLFTGGVGGGLLGYFSSADEVPREAHPFSNAHEMFILNADNLILSGETIRSTLAHEFQHMIHWYVDRNEETWLNEGFSMLAELINDYDPGTHDSTYIRNPDIQLTSWGEPGESNIPHYGAAFLYTAYLLDRFGEEATQAIVADPLNGMESIDHVLQELAIVDPLTGETPSAEDIFADWAVANLLGDATVGDGRYAYGVYPDAPLATANPILTSCPSGVYDDTVRQYGVDYLGLRCEGDWTLTFEGETEVGILPIEAASGDYFFWSNMGDESDMSLEREFDLNGVDGPVEMSFQTWYDLEKDYDYVFVSATTNGEAWQILNTSSCTTEDPSGNSFGCGLNGASDGWQQESVDLSAYAGQVVTVRFDYVTDAAVNGIGMAIDDIRVDAIDYATDLEGDEGGWQADGFVRIENALPQSYRLSLVTYGDEITVTPLELDADNTLRIDISLSGDIYNAVLVISGTTPFTRQSALYTVELLPQGE